ncbi:BMP family ABC transporter substrate-binding protein [Streptomyces sp. XM83C]|jgi:hypothetical protein|uniref:BMP family ABC transporter substrate-binding protein n=1 Tax=Streptomyces thermocoprophilus TaxID=78356 RepID=A0ABV5VMQ6_9ACTN|nr:BMP family ABC transporter substrate-binding protein [Streptomyces sp. XM83C]MCK1820395.1 BMP family ABC transporter substrate-binding protein [Streptomyces sp. XM83C]
MKVRRTWRETERERKKGKGGGSLSGAAVARAAGVARAALRGRRGWMAGGAVAVVVLAVLAVGGVWLFGGDESENTPPDPRARQYTEIDACLLTGEKGVQAGTPAATVWQGMQEASLDTRARVTFVPVMGPQTADNARPFLNSLVQRQCEIVLAVGDAQVEVVSADAGKHRDVRFVVVSDKVSDAANLVVAKPGEALKDTVAEDVRQAVRKVNA